MTGDEFLSGLKKEDKLMPVITLVISLSTEAWNGPLTLHEMLLVENKELLFFVPDYQLNLLAPDKIEDFGKFRTKLGVLFECIKHKQDDNMICDEEDTFRLPRQQGLVVCYLKE